ncbi:serine protease [Deinococcus radiophilus]|uniref:Serine protease n=2 Tax=Deinococcus radiophilus TaxID=32062 RepID=A0A431W482_9DEIO|nr:serine protease [Deinococcus radiophilus]
MKRFAWMSIPSLLLAACGVSSPDTGAQQGGNATARPTPTLNAELGAQIVNGTASALGARPYQVALLKNGSLNCGGSLIAPDWVMTAAHCVSNGSSYGLTIRAGSLYYANGGQTSTVSAVRVHPNYNDSTTANDIALLKLSTPMTLNSNVALGKIPGDSVEAVLDVRGKYAVVSGWGKTGANAGISSNLREVSIPITPNPTTCGSDRPPGNTICGEAYQGKDSCNGDSGGPLAQVLNNKHYVLGIVSYGPSACNGYGVYTRVNAFKSWIQTTSGVVADNGDGTPTDPTPEPTPPTYDRTYEGTLYSGQNNITQYFNYAGGTLTGELKFPAGADFDLYLQKWNGSSWAYVAQADGTSNPERISYTAASGYYRWIVNTYSGSGAYTLGENN